MPPPQAGQPAWSAPTASPPGRSPALRILIILFALASIGFGVWKILDAFHVFNGRGSSYSGTTSTGAEPRAPIDEYWLQGTWTLARGARCATWVRFNSDHTMTDEHGGTGTWALRTWGAWLGDLTITIGGRTPSHVNAGRRAQDVLEINAQTWNRATC